MHDHFVSDGHKVSRSKAADDMSSRAEVKSVPKQLRISKILSRHQHLSSKHQEQQLKMKESVGTISNRFKALESKDGKSAGERGVKDDELVKYMSKLPYYLQRMERGESFQGNALNVGVLDWTRLEKWKHNQKGGHKLATHNAAPVNGMNLSTGTKLYSTNSGVVPNKAPCNQIHHSRSSNGVHSSSKDDVARGLQSSVEKVGPTQEFKPASSEYLDGRNEMTRKHKAPEIIKTRVDPEKSRRTRSSQKATTSGVENMPLDIGISRVRTKYSANALGGETKTRVGRTRELDGCGKDLDQRKGSDLKASSIMSSRYGTSQNFKEERHVVDDKYMKRADRSEIDLTCRQFSDQRRNGFLLRPRAHEGITLSEEPQMALDHRFIEPKLKRFYGDSANQNVHFSELGSQAPRPCLLSRNSKNIPESIGRPHRPNLSSMVSEPSVHVDKRVNESCPCKYSESTSMEARSTAAGERATTLNEETIQEGSRKSRHQTPSKRFSFSLSRISRSFSFKDESSSDQQLSSTYASAKSGPVRSEGSPCSDSSKLEKLPSQNRARASPLRRLLDPLLKHKGKGSVLPGKESPMSSNPTNEKQASTMIHALVQLTVRNGLPLFQFVIDDETNSILAATMNKNTSPYEKGESSQCCTFYSVNEVKKRGGSWISHGNREKRCGFEYNIIGQMRLRNSPSSALINQNRDSRPIAKESVLFETELKLDDHEPEKIKTSRELAAIVIKLPSEISYSDLSWTFEDNVDEFKTTVMLPGGVHSFPENGMPSSLIDRWRTGGLCDCGGWDIGCKLRVMSNHKTFHSLSNASKSHIFHLFEQEEDQQNNPVFRMVPLNNGIYSVEYRSSMSQLQAFHISVTVITCRKSYNVSEIGSPDNSTNSNIRGNKETPVKYASHPPLSPVGRV